MTTDNHDGWSARVRLAMAAGVKYYSTLSEIGLFAFWGAFGLIAIIVPILIVVYRSQIGTAIAFVFACAVGIAVLAVLVRGAYEVARSVEERSRRAAEEQQRAAEAAAVAEEGWQRNRATLLQTIENGVLEPLNDPCKLLLHNSELLWHTCRAIVSEGQDHESEPHAGELYVTSERVVFVCGDYPLEIAVSDINALDRRPDGLQIIARTARKTEMFRVDDVELTAAYVTRAVRAYHRQIDVGFPSDPNRHISQEVKTAVWQRDCGRCVQCGGADYLEFDHIIPHTRGGANTVQNVQLLCRRCNLKKGASI